MSCLALLLSLIAIAVVLPIHGELDFDYYGAILGGLSFLMTILMGYQIYTVINVKEELKEIRQAREEIDRKLEKQKTTITQEYKTEFDNVMPLFMALASKKIEDIIEKSFGIFNRSTEGSWTKNLAREALLLSLLGIKDSPNQNSILIDLSAKVTEQEVITFYKDCNDRTESGNMPDEPELRILLTNILSKIEENSHAKVHP